MDEKVECGENITGKVMGWGKSRFITGEGNKNTM